ncbi:MAG: CvpA family protein [Pseudomonadota bacterium]
MMETLFSSITAFDAIAVLVVIMSALMALSRGFMRELAAMTALIAAIAAAFLGRELLREQIAGWLPENMAAWTADVAIVSVAFLVVYLIVRFVSSRVTSVIQGTEGVTIVDRLAGMVFGAARGGAALVFLAWLMITAVPSDRVPDFISGSASYPMFERAAATITSNAPRVAEDLDGALSRDNGEAEELLRGVADALENARDEE